MQKEADKLLPFLVLGVLLPSATDCCSLSPKLLLPKSCAYVPYMLLYCAQFSYCCEQDSSIDAATCDSEKVNSSLRVELLNFSLITKPSLRENCSDLPFFC